MVRSEWGTFKSRAAYTRWWERWEANQQILYVLERVWLDEHYLAEMAAAECKMQGILPFIQAVSDRVRTP